ncbi:MAG: MarR family transcriptional regulator [Proteobacteria bacterium]|nr:MAG: MarR family transcriptional regulator [Pseudomonadota bacterium]
MTDAPDRLLNIFREAVLSEVRSDQPDLTLRQLAVMLTVYGTDEPQTVRGLAKHLNIGKPPVTRVLNVLGDLDLGQRVIDRLDRRSVNVGQTEAGAAMMQRLAGAMAAASRGS